MIGVDAINEVGNSSMVPDDTLRTSTTYGEVSTYADARRRHFVPAAVRVAFLPDISWHQGSARWQLCRRRVGVADAADTLDNAHSNQRCLETAASLQLPRPTQPKNQHTRNNNS